MELVYSQNRLWMDNDGNLFGFLFGFTFILWEDPKQQKGLLSREQKLLLYFTWMSVFNSVLSPTEL